MSVEVYLLLKSKHGKRKKAFRSVKRGELIEPIPADQKLHTHEDPPHNYRQCTDHEITLYATEQDVAPLNGSEAFYLQAVETYSARTQMYISDTLRLVTNLEIDDKVSVRLEKGVANGVIRHIGAHKENPGIHFGVEILVCTLRLISFACTCTCSYQNTVLVFC